MALKKSRFRFTKQERSGIFYLLLLIILVQTSFWAYRKFSYSQTDTILLDKEVQEQIEKLKDQNAQKDSVRVFPFNPNFISDYKGYALGMSVDEIDRLHKFRDGGQFLNSKEEFQEITGVSDSLLNRISPYFKFPEWAKNQNTSSKKRHVGDNKINNYNTFHIKDLNQVGEEELKSINGIGEKLSERIIKFRDRLGGFLLDDQLNDVYGLEPEVVQRVLQKYKVLNAPQIQKINLNDATSQELSKLVYIQRHVAEQIVEYRELNGGIDSFDDLLEIDDFPANRIDRIPLYLSLKK